MKYCLIILFLFSVLVPSLPQEIIYPVRNFSTRDYGKDFHPQNMSVLQDKRGVIYAANGFMLMEYDGNSWNSYPINREAWILSLATDSSGIIYAGSQNEFGYFLPDVSGRMSYVSLSDSLKVKDLDFTNVWKVYSLPGGIAYQSEENLFLYSNGKLRTIRPQTSFHTSFKVNNSLFIRERNHGLMQLVNDSLQRIPGSEIFDTTGIFLMTPFGRNTGKILIGTQEKGFWIFDTDRPGSGFREFKVRDRALLDLSKISGGVTTGDGLFAISTLLSGVIIIDDKGETRAVIDKTHGINDNDVKQVIHDRDGNLWLATANGISTVEISSPLSYFAQKEGISGSVSSILRYNGSLYAGTNTGLYRQDTDTREKDLFFTKAWNISFPVRCLASDGKSMFAGSENGLFEITDNSFRKADEAESFALFYSPGLRLLFSGGSKGLNVFRCHNTLTRIDLPLFIKEDIVSIGGETVNGDTVTIWIGSRYNGVLSIKIDGKLSARYEYYGKQDGLPEGPVIIFKGPEGPLFGTVSGIFSFISEKAVRDNLPDSLKNNKEFTRGYFTSASISSENDGKSLSALEVTKDRIWVCADNKVSYFDKSAGMKKIHQPFAGIDVGKINFLYPEEGGLCWMGTTDGLIRYDDKTTKNYNAGYFCLLRKVRLLTTDSLLFNGTFLDPLKGIAPGQPSGLIPELTYGQNSIRFEFSTPFFEYPDKIMYSYQINNSRWSQWKNENFQEITNLNEGDYIFRVKAVNAYGTESIPAEYHFSITPPWYRSVIAYIIYVITGFLLLLAFSRAYSWRLKRENIRLEGIVAERTSEIRQQRDEIGKQNKLLENQNKEIEDSIRYASRIQSAVMPSENQCIELFPESFVLFRPLNIVSGDFYWIRRIDDKIIFTAADCTGHGVPGAFMSMLGVAFLNEIVDRDHITEPGMILNHLRQKVMGALQNKGSGESRDGMDISLICIDLKNFTLKYAGAYNPLVMIRDKQVTEMPGDKMPVGLYEKMDPFKQHEVSILKGDVFYLASDGYEDQFGGPDGKKFKSKKFRQMLLEIHHLSMPEQKAILEKRFSEWKGDLKQIDDIVVAGIKIS